MSGILAALAAINLLTFYSFWLDKRQAVIGGRRVSEARLLRLAVIGGTPAALIARQMFRHKTRKQPFSTYLLLIAAVQAGALAVWLFL